MPLYDVEGRGTIWADDPAQAVSFAHGTAGKPEQVDPKTWSVDTGAKKVKVVLRGDSK